MKVKINDIVILKSVLMEGVMYGANSFEAGMKLPNNSPLKVINTYENDTKFAAYGMKGFIYNVEMVEKIIKPMKTGGSTPNQYGIPEGAKDLQDLIEYRAMNFALGNIFKACYRLGFKDNPELYELEKIEWFAKRLIKQAKKKKKIGDFKL